MSQLPCPLFGKCGGCQVMDLSESEQLEMKRQKVVDALKAVGIDGVVLPCLGSPHSLQYRNKLQFPVRKKEKGMAFGLYAVSSNELVEIETCPVHCKLGDDVYQKTTEILKRSSLVPYDPLTKKGEFRHLLIRSALRTNQALVVLVTSEKPTPYLFKLGAQILESHPAIQGVVHNLQEAHTNVILGSTYQLLAGVDSIEEELNGLRFKISAGSFFQINPEQAEKLFEKALEIAELKGTETVLDAYCGVGTLSLIFAKRAKSVLGIESTPQAILSAEENKRLNQIENVSFICAPVEKEIESLSSIDIALLNPPRKGCDRSFLEKLVHLDPEKIIYISCSPESLARDLRFLTDAGYKMDPIQPFDMFPQTTHVESLAHLYKKPMSI